MTGPDREGGLAEGRVQRAESGRFLVAVGPLLVAAEVLGKDADQLLQTLEDRGRVAGRLQLGHALGDPLVGLFETRQAWCARLAARAPSLISLRCHPPPSS